MDDTSLNRAIDKQTMRSFDALSLPLVHPLSPKRSQRVDGPEVGNRRAKGRGSTRLTCAATPPTPASLQFLTGAVSVTELRAPWKNPPYTFTTSTLNESCSAGAIGPMEFTVDAPPTGKYFDIYQTTFEP